VVPHDRRERFDDQLADRECFCGGLHLPPPHAYFDGDAALERPESSHIGQVCWQLGRMASGQKLDTAQISRQETITDIKTAARAQLAEGGPAGISLT
jgi:hypothetical protein